MADEIGFVGVSGVDFKGGEFEEQGNFGIEFGAREPDAFGEFELIGQGLALLGKLSAGGFEEFGGGGVGGLGSGRADDEPNDGVALLKAADEFGASRGFGEAFGGFSERADPVINDAVAAMSGAGNDAGEIGLRGWRKAEPELAAGGDVLRERRSGVGEGRGEIRDVVAEDFQIGLAAGAGESFPCCELFGVGAVERAAMEDDQFDGVSGPAFERVAEDGDVARGSGGAEEEECEEVAGHGVGSGEWGS